MDALEAGCWAGGGAGRAGVSLPVLDALRRPWDTRRMVRRVALAVYWSHLSRRLPCLFTRQKPKRRMPVIDTMQETTQKTGVEDRRKMMVGERMLLK